MYECWFLALLGMVVIFSKVGIDRIRGFSRQTLEKRPLGLLLLACIAYTTLHCTTVHACDYEQKVVLELRRLTI